MVPCIMDLGRKGKAVESVRSLMLMGTSTKASGSMIKPMDMALTIISMEQSTLVNGEMTNR